MLADYHMHTHFSSDSDANPSEHIEKAISLGMSELCFTDHVDFDYPKENGKTMFHLDADSYFEELYRYKHEYEDKIKVKIGVELGLNPHNEEYNHNLVKTHPFDFVIGSSHIVDGIDPYYPEYWEGRTIKESITRYYEAILRNVTTEDVYDVYGHLDYIRRYVPDKNFVYDDRDYYDITESILTNIITKGHGLELNTRGLESGLTNFLPTIALLQRYHDMGGEIVTVGSDAHYTKNVGYGFKTAREILINTGFKYVASFEHRSVSFIPL